MVGTWLIQLTMGIVKVLLNPLLYWFVLLGIVTSYRRLQVERQQFGFKIFDMFSEWKNTLRLSLLFGLVISLITVGLGVVFTQEIILTLSVVTILLSLTFNLSLLSSSYTLGLTYLMLLLSPLILNRIDVTVPLLNHIHYTGIVILIGLLLIIESIFIKRLNRNELFPKLILSQRGVWVGEHHIKKLTMIPFFVLIPSGIIGPIGAFWPYFTLGGETYSFILVPFVLGFNFKVAGSLAPLTINTISNRVALLGFIVILFAVGSIFIPLLSLVAVVGGLLGREAIFYRQRMNDKRATPFYVPLDSGLKILAVIPHSPADRLGVLSGEIITKVNDIPVNTKEEFYKSLQNSGASFKLDIIDDRDEVRFLTGAFFESEHHELGIVIPQTPYSISKENIV